MFFLLAQLAVAAEITVYTQTPAIVSVDGAVLDYDEGSLLLVARNLKAGRHSVKVGTVAGKSVTQIDVMIQQTDRVDLVYAQRTITQVGGGLVGDPALTARDAAVPAFGSAVGGAQAGATSSASAGGASASMGGMGMGYAGVNAGPNGAAVVMSDGMGGKVTMSAGMPQPTVVVVTSPAPPPPPPVKAEPPKPEPVQVVFSLKDTFDMSNVYVDGKRVAEFRTGDHEKTVTLMSGTHTVEIKEFTEFDTWFKGKLTVTPGEPLRFGYGEDEGVEVYNRPATVWVQQ